ncbi:BatD family protein [uncultured Muriicola sp.]|uniref:BatD family protein n=1 Tax=uncultured Muriicola sp. TaxID=1583102 RepID=UPI00261B2EF0|nr:BatD family protein [uncultured Muriicola sp.]
MEVRLIGRGLAVLIMFFTLAIKAQTEPRVSTSVDTTSIKIGEQIQFQVTVEADTTAQVIFPEGQTFSPLETVEAFKTDTTKKQPDRMTLQKIYALTQFDSGTFTLPIQRIEIDGKGYFTDSLIVQVTSVEVDTITKEIYDIKPLIPVEKNSADIQFFLWIILGVLILAGLVYWFFFRKKRLSEDEKEALLPPYDRALLELKRLENSRYIIQDEYKKYYSELTDIVRSYLEEDVHISALESTTSQLISKLELMKDAGTLRIEADTIDQFKKILETADLVKFARSKPESSKAEQDRKAIEQIVIKTKEAIPEPTEEELMQEAAYQEALLLRKKRKRWVLAGVSAAAILVLALGVSMFYYGYENVRDTVVRNPSKRLLEGEWVSSSYGYPPIDLSAPEVLIRQEVVIPPEEKDKIQNTQVFSYYNPNNMLGVGTTSTTLTEPTDPDYQKSIDEVLKDFADKGARNIITKQEEFSSASGVPGLKVYGSGTFQASGSGERVKGKYAIILFGGKGFQQQIVLSWEDGDSYAEEIINRIINSIDVKTQV